MSRMVTISERIEALVIRLDGAAICDTCVGDRLDLTPADQAVVVTSALGGQTGYARKKDACALCGKTRLVISRTIQKRR